MMVDTMSDVPDDVHKKGSEGLQPPSAYAKALHLMLHMQREDRIGKI
jgi:hypothetical protein